MVGHITYQLCCYVREDIVRQSEKLTKPDEGVDAGGCYIIKLLDGLGNLALVC